MIELNKKTSFPNFKIYEEVIAFCDSIFYIIQSEQGVVDINENNIEIDITFVWDYFKNILFLQRDPFEDKTWRLEISDIIVEIKMIIYEGTISKKREYNLVVDYLSNNEIAERFLFNSEVRKGQDSEFAELISKTHPDRLIIKTERHPEAIAFAID